MQSDPTSPASKLVSILQSDPTSPVSHLVLFSIKATITLVLFIIAVVVLMPDLSALTYSIRKEARNEKTRVALMSFIQNPAALYRASEIDEKEGNIDSAVMEMQMAIGLMEMHNANPLVIKRYTARLDHLNSQLKTISENTPSTVTTTGTYNGKAVKRWKE
jgi:hypothetical protein